jgi:hypothetical protein
MVLRPWSRFSKMDSAADGAEYLERRVWSPGRRSRREPRLFRSGEPAENRSEGACRVLIRMLWVEEPHAMHGVLGEADQSVLDHGEIEPRAVSDFPGPPGAYRRLPEELWRTMWPDDPTPVFLHESYEVGMERWMNSLPDAAAEVAIVARVRDAVMHLVEARLAADPRAFSASPTVTTTESTIQGMAVVGRCVVLRPARRQHRMAPSAAEPWGPSHHEV